MSFCLVLTTVARKAQARKLARYLLKERLAACVTIQGPTESHYRWKGKQERTNEYLLLIKTKASRYKLLEKRLSKKHPYKVPEIVALPIEKGYSPYLKWLAAEVR